MSSTVAVGNLELTSTDESAAEMAAVLKPAKEGDSKEPRILEDAGKAVEPEEGELSQAARELGKKGGEAAAKARAERDKEPDKTEDTSEAKSKEGKAEGEDKSEDKPSRAKGRIEELARQRAEERRAREAAEAKARDLEARLARLEARDGAKGGEAPEKSVTPKSGGEGANGKPTPDRFDTYEEFVEALTDWKADQVLERESRRVREQQEAQAHIDRVTSKVQGFADRLRAAEQEDGALRERIDPRFFDLVPTSMLPPGSQVGPLNDIAEVIIESDYAPRLMVYLSEHEDEMQALTRLPDSYAVTRAIGRIEARLESEPPPIPKGTSKAPPPMRPVTPSSITGEPDLTGEIDLDTFAKRRGYRR